MIIQIRFSYTDELHVPSSYMQAVWDMLKEAGEEFGIRNFGVEAQNVLRMEKGHIILGQESEQRANLLDLGLGFLWDHSKSEAKTVGTVALHQAENDAGPLKLVGIRMEDDTRPARDGALIVDSKVRGYVATMRKSITTGEAVGMALVESQLTNIGTRLEIFEDECNGVRLNARVVTMPFYDPKDGAIDRLAISDQAVPETAGQCAFAAQLLINRMNGIQASIYHLGVEAPALPDFPGYTDVTESTVFLSLFGPNAFDVAEKLSNLDLMDPTRKAPFLLQGPFCHVPCQIVTLEKTLDGSGGYLLTCSRGYGDSMVGAILKAGEEYGLQPAGEDRFTEWVKVLQE